MNGQDEQDCSGWTGFWPTRSSGISRRSISIPTSSRIPTGRAHIGVSPAIGAAWPPKLAPEPGGTRPSWRLRQPPLSQRPQRIIGLVRHTIFENTEARMNEFTNRGTERRLLGCRSYQPNIWRSGWVDCNNPNPHSATTRRFPRTVRRRLVADRPFQTTPRSPAPPASASWHPRAAVADRPRPSLSPDRAPVAADAARCR